MDNNDRRPRQNPPGYAGQPGTLLQPQAQYPVFVGPTIQTSYGAQEYGAEPQQQQQPAPQRASQYGQYGQGVMYTGVPGAQAAAGGQAQYESVQQPYEASTSFGVAQAQYYGVQEGPTSAPASAIAPQNVPSQYSSLGYSAPQASVGREPYPAASMANPHQAPAQSGYQQHAQVGFGGGGGGDQASGSDYDDFYNTYQTELKKTFEHTRDGRLREAAEQLVRLSDWLLQWAETLVRDEETQYEDRLRLWEQFNNCWLTTLQKQKEMAQEMIKRGQRPQPPQSLIEPDYLEKMGTQLIKSCDNMEKHGLVDYQMGVWEEEIIAMLTSCLDLWEQVGVAPGSSQRLPAASSSRRR
ncbi:hypothetical protein K491DRAFT_26517 [Lophiostoma macrostomum CBS 122681]|uniref:Uncharacterized protein n=1 Tax=Lophiostoma macrostomum CBS 122681 TaxID=1314788 RepID=A0A6A6T1Y8_9PLEO|nr:hypothetical protein K491DRAFT_26517 [Lophiostoma macrostomum CBS 122681]